MIDNLAMDSPLLTGVHTIEEAIELRGYPRKRETKAIRRRRAAVHAIRGYILAAEQFAQHFHKSSELMGAEAILRNRALRVTKN